MHLLEEEQGGQLSGAEDAVHEVLHVLVPPRQDHDQRADALQLHLGQAVGEKHHRHLRNPEVCKLGLDRRDLGLDDTAAARQAALLGEAEVHVGEADAGGLGGSPALPLPPLVEAALLHHAEPLVDVGDPVEALPHLPRERSTQHARHPQDHIGLARLDHRLARGEQPLLPLARRDTEDLGKSHDDVRLLEGGVEALHLPYRVVVGLGLGPAREVQVAEVVLGPRGGGEKLRKRLQAHQGDAIENAFFADLDSELVRYARGIEDPLRRTPAAPLLLLLLSLARGEV
mmetsp:Transcript_12865/g.40669  ORF Transcript_12865/g.40669 Transcript_12865/m.40669 type:complete len:286 (-) Transcript_12865:174-1031(-)